MFCVTGVFATYYNDVSATYYNHPYEALSSPTISKITASSDVTIRYSGLFRAESTSIYTFQPYQSTDYNDRVKLWLDSELIIDQVGLILLNLISDSLCSGLRSLPAFPRELSLSQWRMNITRSRCSTNSQRLAKLETCNSFTTHLLEINSTRSPLTNSLLLLM